jgi:flagellin-like hook-associated protein FlgL
MSTITTIGARAIDQARMRERTDLLTRQLSTGQKGVRHGDLGPEARRAIDLRGEIARREAAAAAADRAISRAGTAGQVLDRLHAIARDVSAEAARARTLGASGLGSLVGSARAALEEAATLLNTRHGGEYLFNGSDVANPPVPAGAAISGGAMATAIGAAVATLTPLNAAAVLAATTAAATAPGSTPFSAFLEGPALAEPPRAVQVADGERVAIGVFANRDSSGAVGASWGRELLRGLATLAALTPVQAAQGAGYDALLEGVRGTLSGAASGIAAESGALGAAERRIETARDRHGDTLVLLRASLGGVEEVDPAAVMAELRAIQTRLEASYQATSMLAGLSLAALLR